MPSTQADSYVPVTPEHWGKLVRLFGDRGACGGCWCMAWRLSPPELETGKGNRNRAGLQRLVNDGPPPGVLALRGEEPIGWCAVAPRSAYRYLQVSRVLRPVDDAPVWSITCLFIDRRYRRQGMSGHLLRAAALFARSQGACIVEGYPVEVKRGHRTADVFAWTGLAQSFLAAGFSEVARRSPTRPIMRLNFAGSCQVGV